MRFGITAAAFILGLALVGQVTVWALIHYTDIRTIDVGPDHSQDPLRVVKIPAPAAPMASNPGAAATKPKADSLDPTLPPDAGASEVASRTNAKASPAHPVSPPKPTNPADANHVPGKADVTLRQACDLVQSIGVIAAIMLGLLMFQAVNLAGGGGIPGVEKAVTAGTWTLVIVLLCVPLDRYVPNLPMKGVFLAYEGLVRDSIGYRLEEPGAPGALGFFGLHLVVPVVILAGLALVVLRFRAGIDQGVIVTNISQLDEKLEREIRTMKLGRLSSPRAVGALHSAIGDVPVNAPPAAMAPEAAPRAVRPSRSATVALDDMDPPPARGAQPRPMVDPALTDSRRPI